MTKVKRKIVIEAETEDNHMDGSLYIDFADVQSDGLGFEIMLNAIVSQANEII